MVDLCFTTDYSFFLLSYFRRLISELGERNSTKIGHMLGSNRDLKTHVQNLGYPLHPQIGVKNHLFAPLRNLMAILIAYTFGTKHDIDNRLRALTTKGVSYIVPKFHELFRCTNGFKADRHLYPPYVNSAFYVIARLRRRKLANRTQPNFAKRRMVNRANNSNSWGRPSGRNGAKKLLHLFGFSATSTPNGQSSEGNVT